MTDNTKPWQDAIAATVAAFLVVCGCVVVGAGVYKLVEWIVS